MRKEKIKILHLEDFPADAEIIANSLRKSGLLFEKRVVDNREDYIEALDEYKPDIILSDHSLPTFNSVMALKVLREKQYNLPFILVTSTMSEEFAVEVMKLGACDYLLKDHLQRLPSAIVNAMERFEYEQERILFIDRIIAKDALQKEAEKMANFGIWQIDLSNYTTMWSDETFRMLNYEPGEVIPSYDKFRKNVHPEDLPILDKLLQDSYNTINSAEFDIRILQKDQHLMYVHIELIVKRDETGSPKMITGFMIDITREKEAMDALRISELKHRTLIEQAPDGIFVFNARGEIVNANTSGSRMIGFSIDEILSMTVDQIVQTDELDKMPIRYQELEENKTLFSERTFCCKNGKEILVEVSGTKLPDGLYQVICRDITERKANEILLNESRQQLRNLATHLQKVREEERTDIAREIHDEMAQLLTALKLDIAYIKSKLSHENQMLIEKIREAENISNTIINTVRRIASRLRPVQLDELGLAAALEWQTKEFELRTGIKSVFTTDIAELQLTKEESIGIFRIYQESLTNILRHSEASEVHTSFTFHETYVQLTVRDNGKGFDTESVKSKKRFGLLGMKERVEIINGELDIQSQTGQGTTLYVKKFF